MNRCKQRVCVLFFMVSLAWLFAGERSIPVDIYILVDTSLSMEEPGRFDSMQKWVTTHLLGQMLIPGDTVTLYQFYGKTERLLSLTVQTEEDRQKILTVTNALRPNGEYTDIGLALDTLKKDLDARGPSDQYTVLLLLTDLKQEAPWSSRYSGTQDTFESPYLAQARILQHDNWYEITLDMDIQDRVVMTTKELYSSIIATQGTSAEVLPEGGTLTEVQQESVAKDMTGSIEYSDAQSGEADGVHNKQAPLPQRTLIVVGSLILLACLTFAGLAVARAKKRREEQERPN